jgi:hypothetical protein
MIETPSSILLNDLFISFRLIESHFDPILSTGRIGKPAGSRSRKEAKMSILNAFDHYVAGFRARRDAARTERMISSLPLEVQKDIGWPHPHEDARARLVRERFHNFRA